MAKTDPSPYQQHLTAWRELRGLTQEQVAEKFEVDHTTVGRWENGALPISSKWLVALCRLYKVTPDQLLITPERAAARGRADELRQLVEDINDKDFERIRDLAERLRGAA